MSTTRIQLKRADDMNSLNTVVLAKGEPAVYFNNNTSGVLYIGNGIASPGLQFATSGTSVTQHQIANTTNIGPEHSIVATHAGSVLTAIDTDDAKMQRLGFYDLGAVQPLSSGLNALGISDILHSGTDSTGIRSRWHWMATSHVAPRRSLFYTTTIYSTVGNGSSGSGGVGNMEHSSVTNADTRIGYQVENLTYDYESVDGLTALTGTDSGVMALVAKKSGANNVLEFRRLVTTDIGGDLATHAITSVSHTGTASSIYHTAAASTSITALSYAAAANGSVLKKSSTGILHFAQLGYSDITGVFHISGDYAGQEAFTMRYDGTGANAWEACSFVKSVVNTTYAQSNISNGALDGRTPSLIIKDYDSEYLSSLEIMILKGTQADLNSYGANRIVISSGKDASTINRDILFYTRLSRQSDVAPNFWMREDGSFWVNSSDDTRGTTYNWPKDITDMNRGIYVYPKKMGRISGSLSDYPGWAGLEIGTLQHNQAIASTPSILGLNGIKIGSITSLSSGSATVASHHNLFFLNCGNLNTPASVTGIKLGTLTSGMKSDANAIGIQITSVTSQDLATSTGILINSIISDSLNGASVGLDIKSITSGLMSVAMNCPNLSSNGDSIFLLFGDSTANYQSRAMLVDKLDSTGSASAFAIGTEITEITSTQLAIGGYYPNISGGIRSIGLFLGMNNPELTYSSITESSVAIFTAGGKHIFGGDIDVTGNLKLVGTSTFDGNVLVDDGHLLTVSGITGGNAITINNGNLKLNNGIVIDGGYLYIDNATDQPDHLTTFLSTGAGSGNDTVLDIKKYSCLVFSTPPEADDPTTLLRIAPGYPGQKITIAVKYQSGKKNRMELKCAAVSNTQAVALERKSNIVLNDATFNQIIDLAPNFDQALELHIYPNFPVTLQYIPDYRNTSIEWIDTEAGVNDAGKGAWVVLTPGRKGF